MRRDRRHPSHQGSSHRAPSPSTLPESSTSPKEIRRAPASGASVARRPRRPAPPPNSAHVVIEPRGLVLGPPPQRSSAWFRRVLIDVRRQLGPSPSPPGAAISAWRRWRSRHRP
jgi:hypothetical protein